jgi:hypothetical protein
VFLALLKAANDGIHKSAVRLLVDEVDDMNPNDVSYVYSGYAPLSVRLVQCVSMKPAVLATSPEPSRPGPDCVNLFAVVTAVAKTCDRGLEGI